MAVLQHPLREQLQLADVFTALGHPVRLGMVRQLADARPRPCNTIEVGVTKATATHHWRVLRDAGVLRQWQDGRTHYVALRRDDLEARFPGLLAVALAEAAGPPETDATAGSAPPETAQSAETAGGIGGVGRTVGSPG